jgi:hypothetical protein
MNAFAKPGHCQVPPKGSFLALESAGGQSGIQVVLQVD